MTDYKEIAKQCRIKCLELIFKAGTSHIGSNYSCTDLLTVLFEHINFNQDKFIAAKSWAAATVYYFLWRRGRITEAQLNSFCQKDSPFIGLVEPVCKDLPFGIGAMGYGLSAACGFAWSKKENKEDGRIFVLESDGGMQVPTNWGALMFAGHHKLNKICLIIDRNGFCAMGKTDHVLRQKYLPTVLKQMGWSVQAIDGHNFGQIENALKVQNKKPRCIIADTLKGKGVSFFEGNNLWHYAQIKEDDYTKGLSELNARIY